MSATLLLWLWAAPAWAVPVEVRIRQRGDAEPLPQAEVQLDGVPVALDARGRATLDLPEGTEVTLVVRSQAHEGQTITFTPPLERPLDVYLKVAASPGEIVVEAFRPTSDITRHHVDAEMAYETPGTYDDAVRLVQSLPGVNVQREYAPSSGDVSVRGSLPGDNRYYLDGIEVPYLYHFNQYASVFPASQLDSLDLYSSGYGVKYGDSVGAVVEAVSDVEAPKDVTGHATFNTVTFGADVKAPLKDGWWMAVSGRRSFHDIAGGTEQFPLWPVFYDFYARAEKVRESDTFGVWAAGAGDRYDRTVGELDVLDPYEDTQAPGLTYERNYQIAGFTYRWKGGRLSAATVHDHLVADVENGGRQDQRTLQFPVRVDARGNLSEAVSWEAGGELRSEVMFADLVDAGVLGSLVTTEAPAAAWGLTTQQTLLRTRLAGYGEIQAKLGPRVRLMSGLRVGVDSAGWEPLVEPRLALRWRVADQTELRLGGGRYQQRPETINLLADAELPTTSAWEVSGGLDQTIANRVEIVLEGYGKFLDNVIWQPPVGAPRVAERGTAYGAELTLRYRMRETFFLWAWFAYGRAFLDEGNGAFTSRADQPLSGGLVASWNIKPQINLALRYRAASGLPFTNIDGSLYDATTDSWTPRFASPFADRLPFYHKIDVHFAYTFLMRKWSLALAVDLWIVPPGATQLYPTWNYDFTEQGWVEGPVLLPLFGLRASF